MYYSLIETALGEILDEKINDKLFDLNDKQMRTLIININEHLLADSDFNDYVDKTITYYARKELIEKDEAK